MARAVFLDRDGVLNAAIVRNGKPFPPASVEELQIFPEAPEALAALKQRGFLLIVITNQPDVARGTQTKSSVEAIHAALTAALPLDAVFTCYHDDADRCDCRKPKPGMLLRAFQDFKIDASLSYMVGDRWRDIDAGASAGCKTVWIDYNYAERAPASRVDARVASVAEAAAWIINDRTIRIAQ